MTYKSTPAKLAYAREYAARRKASCPPGTCSGCRIRPAGTPYKTCEPCRTARQAGRRILYDGCRPCVRCQSTRVKWPAKLCPNCPPRKTQPRAKPEPPTEELSVKKVLTTGEAAKVCKSSPKAVAKWVDSGRLKGYRIPGSQVRRIPREQLVRFLKEHGMPLGDLEDVTEFRVLTVSMPEWGRDRLRSLLPADDGYRHGSAWTAVEAGLILAAAPPDVVIVSAGLGRADAVSVGQTARRHEPTAGCLLVGLAGADEPNPEMWTTAGFDVVLPEPHDLGAVADLIRKRAATKREG